MHANTKTDKFLLMQACRCTSSKVAVVVLAHPVTAGSQEGGVVSNSDQTLYYTCTDYNYNYNA